MEKHPAARSMPFANVDVAVVEVMLSAVACMPPAKVEVAIPETVKLPLNVPDETEMAPEMVEPEMVPPEMFVFVIVPPVMAGVVMTVFWSWSILLVRAMAAKLLL